LPLWLVGPDMPSTGRANYRHALIIPTCFNPRSDKPYQNNHQFWQYTVFLRLQRLTDSQKACWAYYGICISHSGSTTARRRRVGTFTAFVSAIQDRRQPWRRVGEDRRCNYPKSSYSLS